MGSVCTLALKAVVAVSQVFSVVIVQSVVVTKIISSQNFNFFLFGGGGAI